MYLSTRFYLVYIISQLTNERSCRRAMLLGNFQCRPVLLILTIIEQGPTVLAVGACGDLFVYFSLLFHILFPFSRR